MARLGKRKWPDPSGEGSCEAQERSLQPCRFAEYLRSRRRTAVAVATTRRHHGTGRKDYETPRIRLPRVGECAPRACRLIAVSYTETVRWPNLASVYSASARRRALVLNSLARRGS